MENIKKEREFQHLDARDPLQKFRDRFVISDPSVIYLDGNSLGRLPKETVEVIDQTVQAEWGDDLIASWNKSWYHKSHEIGNVIAKIIGAKPGEVIISDNTSVNLYKLAKAALHYQSNRNIILTDEFNFPSDIYILEELTQNASRNVQLDFLKSEDGVTISDAEIAKKLNPGVALVSLSHVAFKSAYKYDMQKVTRMAHEHGALVLWDLSHSVGAVPIDLQAWCVDLAVGCTYKYLNAGPGAPAFLYVRKELQDKLSSPIWGWFGADQPFQFSLEYTPNSGIRRFLSGTPPMLSVAAIKPGAELILEAGMEAIHQKSMLMTDIFIRNVSERLTSFGFSVASPLSREVRGSHISIRHAHAGKIIKALMDRSIDGFSVVPDFRTPDNIRFGFAPLYNSFRDLEIALNKLLVISRDRLYDRYDDTIPEVT